MNYQQGDTKFFQPCHEQPCDQCGEPTIENYNIGSDGMCYCHECAESMY